MNFVPSGSVEESRASRWTDGGSSRLNLESYRSALIAHARRMGQSREDAEDAAQTTLIKAYRATIHTDGNPLGFLLRILVRVVVDAKRYAKTRPVCVSIDAASPSGESYSEILPSPSEGSEPVVSDETRRLLSSLVAQLPEDQREVMRLQLSGLGYREIAKRTGVPVGTVRSRLNRARRSLRGRLEGLALS